MKLNFRKFSIVMLFAALFCGTSCEETPSVPEPIQVLEINLTPSEIAMKVGDKSVQISAEVLPSEADNKELSWSVKDAEPAGCVAVSSQGVVTANLAGTATVVATAKDGSMIKSECSVTVGEKDILVSEIQLIESLSMEVGSTTTFEYTVLPQNATNSEVEISLINVSPEGAITLDDEGVISAEAAGVATLLIKSTDGSDVTAFCGIKSGVKYSIGDLYPNDEEPIGIVFYTAEGGLSGKIMSLTGKSNVMWCEDEEFTYSNSTTDGLANMVTITSVAGWVDIYPAHVWVYDLNNDINLEYAVGSKNVWYMPSSLELHQIFAGSCGLQWIEGEDGVVENGTITDWDMDDNMPQWEDYADVHDAFVQKIVDAGGDYLNDDFYWSSTENANDGRVPIIGLKRGNLIYSGYKDTAISLRAIYAY